jgi:predicted acyltransferase
MPLVESQPAGQPSTQPINVSTTAATSGRVVSLDALRGFDMFWIIGADAVVQALNKLAGGGNGVFSSIVGALANQLDHVQWAGFHAYDLIFPLFVFIVGVSIVFSLTKRVAQFGKAAATKQVLRRFVILYLLGLFAYGGIDQGIEHVRLLGVLQRIALCYFFGALAFIYLKPKTIAALCAFLLIGYWALMTFVPVPGVGAGNFEEGKNLANYIDAHYLPLRKWDGDHDPEGLLSTLPAIASALLGIFAGLLLRNPEIEDRRKVKILLGCGAAGIVLGALWGLQFPIIKKIWSSSFVLVAGGCSAILLGLFYYIVDIRKHQKWAAPFLWIGSNAITIYMVAHVVDLDKLATRLVGGEVSKSLESVHPGLGQLLITAVVLGAAVLFCRFLYRRKIFLKV